MARAKAATKQAAPELTEVPASPVRVEYMELSELRKYPNNPKMHDLDALGASFDEQGFVDPIVIDEKSGMIGAGHGRLEELERRLAAKERPPERIAVVNGKWYVPVLRGISFKSEEAFRKYVIGANRISEIGGWDNKLLAPMLAGMDAEGLLATGFDEDDVVKFMRLAKSEGAANFLDPFNRMSSGSDSLDRIEGYLTFALKVTPEQDARLQAGLAKAKRKFKVKTNLDAILALCDSIRG